MGVASLDCQILHLRAVLGRRCNSPVGTEVAAKALESERQNLEAYKVEDLIPIRLDVVKTISTVVTVAHVAVAERGLYEKTFRDFEVPLIDTLERVAQATWMAET